MKSKSFLSSLLLQHHNLTQNFQSICCKNTTFQICFAINAMKFFGYKKLNILAYKCEQLFTYLNVAISFDRLILSNFIKVQTSLVSDRGATKGFAYNAVCKIILNFQNVIQF